MGIVKERLEEYFLNTRNSESMDQVVQYLSMTDQEIEALGEQRINVLVAIPQNIRADRQEPESMYEEGESSNTRPSRRPMYHQTSYISGMPKAFRSGKTSGYKSYNIPEEYQPSRKRSGTNMLNLDCVTNRRQLIEEWDAEMRLIIQTDDYLRDDFDLIQTLMINKISGNVKKVFEGLDLAAFQKGSGEDFLRHITNAFYSIFVGADYLLDGEATRAKEAEEARTRLTRLQICNLCYLEEFFCDYETNMMVLPLTEWPAHVESFLRKIPFVGEKSLAEYKKLSTETAKSSLAGAKQIVRKQMEKHCKDRQIKKQLRGSNMCCPDFIGPDTIYGCKPKELKSHYKRKYKKKYKFGKTSKKKYQSKRKDKRKDHYFRKKKRGSHGRKRDQQEWQAPEDPKEQDKKKFCPQGKPTCKCWVCNEVGHYARDCTKKTAQTLKAVIEYVSENELEYVYSDDELSDYESDDSLYYLTEEEEEDEDGSD